MIKSECREGENSGAQEGPCINGDELGYVGAFYNRWGSLEETIEAAFNVAKQLNNVKIPAEPKEMVRKVVTDFYESARNSDLKFLIDVSNNNISLATTIEELCATSYSLQLKYRADEAHHERLANNRRAILAVAKGQETWGFQLSGKEIHSKIRYNNLEHIDGVVGNYMLRYGIPLLNVGIAAIGITAGRPQMLEFAKIMSPFSVFMALLGWYKVHKSGVNLQETYLTQRAQMLVTAERADELLRAYPAVVR